MILLIVVIMMQVVCYEKKRKEKRKRGKAQPFCTGCLYVWEELPKINKDTVVNTESYRDVFVFFFTFNKNNNVYSMKLLFSIYFDYCQQIP